MNLHLKDKIALITGASKGIGRAIALRLAEEGCQLRLASRNESDLLVLQQALVAQFGVSVKIFPVDLSEGDAARQLLAANSDIDFLINNAGAIPGGSIEAIDEATWRDAWDLKVFGYINTCREAFRVMKQRKRGVILNIIGAGGEKPTPGYVVGGAGNAALMAMTRALGSNSLKDGVRVLAINPGLIKTGRMETQLRRRALSMLGDAERWQELVDANFPPAGPEVIADMAAFLVSDISHYTTGTVITIDGGASAR